MKILVFLALVVMIQSCDMNKLPPKEYNYEHSRVYKKTCDETWNKINDWMIKKKVDTKMIDKEDGLIQFEMNIPDSLVYKYTDYIPTNYQNDFLNVVGSIYILIKPIGNYSEIEIIVAFEGVLEVKRVWFKGQTTERESVKHTSTGILEKEILDYISNK